MKSIFVLLHTISLLLINRTVEISAFTNEDRNLTEYKNTCRKAYVLSPEDGTVEISSYLFGEGANYGVHSTCDWTFIGRQECLPQIMCPTVDLRPDKCKDSLEINDGLGGARFLCGNKSFTETYTSSNGGRDIFVKFIVHEQDSTFARPYQGFRCIVSCAGTEPDPDEYDIPPVSTPAVPLPQHGLPRITNPMCECGKLTSDDYHGVGDENGSRKDFPWQAAIVIPETRVPMCAATIINNRYVMTAAHCFAQSNLHLFDFQVLVRAFHMDEMHPDESQYSIKWHNLYKSAKFLDEKERTQRFWATNIRTHKLYNKQNRNDYDITLVRLDRRIEFSGLNRPTSICLPKPGKHNETYDNRMAIVAGWGLLDAENGTNNNDAFLQKLIVPIVPQKMCSDVLNKTLSPRMMCAGDLQGDKDACKGDSGGPLMLKEARDRYVQIGIVSLSKGCARKKRPGVYTKVTELVQWIYYNSNDPSVHWCVEK